MTLPDGRQLRPEQVLAGFLNKMFKDESNERMKGFYVFALPIYSKQKESKALEDALEIIGMKKEKYSIISETYATNLYYAK